MTIITIIYISTEVWGTLHAQLAAAEDCFLADSTWWLTGGNESESQSPSAEVVNSTVWIRLTAVLGRKRTVFWLIDCCANTNASVDSSNDSNDTTVGVLTQGEDTHPVGRSRQASHSDQSAKSTQMQKDQFGPKSWSSGTESINDQRQPKPRQRLDETSHISINRKSSVVIAFAVWWPAIGRWFAVVDVCPLVCQGRSKIKSKNNRHAYTHSDIWTQTEKE